VNSIKNYDRLFKKGETKNPPPLKAQNIKLFFFLCLATFSFSITLTVTTEPIPTEPLASQITVEGRDIHMRERQRDTAREREKKRKKERQIDPLNKVFFFHVISTSRNEGR